MGAVQLGDKNEKGRAQSREMYLFPQNNFFDVYFFHDSLIFLRTIPEKIGESNDSIHYEEKCLQRKKH